MKKRSVLSLISALFIVTAKGFCLPVLISVELPTMESKKAWHRLNIPTYELIGNTAIAEAEESQIDPLKQRGFQVNIIDQQPDLSKYVLISRTAGTKWQNGSPIWQKGESTILKLTSKNSYRDKKYSHLIRPMNNKSLGERFWKSITAKYVPPKSIPYDPFIQSLVDQVNADSIAANIQRMQDFSTREMLSDSGFAASAWLANKYAEMGLNGQLDDFYFVYQPNPLVLFGWERNALGTIAGKYSKTIITGGHLDTASDSLGCAPGADDDASGVAGAMEIARIMKNYNWDATMVFTGWAGEECGEGVGSTHYAKSADSIGQNIVGVVNLDMIGYMSDSVLQCAVFCGHYNSLWLRALFVEAGQQYVPSLSISEYYMDIHCDNYFFSREGYPAITAIDAGYENPYVHTAFDLLSTLSPQSYVAYTQTALATMALLDRFPAQVESVKVKDMGTGDKLWVEWILNEESNVNSYRIYWGRQSGAYTDSAESDTASFEISELMSDTAYYITVRAINGEGYVSPVAYEEIGVPKVAPLTPSGLLALPVINANKIQWIPNQEQDLYCYRLYKRINDLAITDSFDIYNANDTIYTDSTVSGDKKYYYWLRSIDNDGNFSPLSDSVYCRPITLDQGVLLVDETNNWTTGSFPRDAQQDSFYDYIMAGYKYEQYEYGSSVQKPVLADFGPYSTVVWFADDYTTMLASGAVNDLKDYLGAGGKLWYAGWKPSGNIHNTTSYPADYTSGDVSYDQFKITHTELSGAADSFQAAIGLRGYPDIAIDTLKYPGSTLWGKTMRYIETLTPLAGADTIYVMGMKNEGSPFEGRACAVRDSGKTVFFGFPMYFMDKEQAKLAAEKLMAEFGEEPLGVAEKPETENRTMQFRLDQNAPNPFNKQTTIRYQLPKAVVVQLNIYNIAGQLVKTFDEGCKPAGVHQINWKDNLLPNGIYFYRLQAGDLVSTKRLLIVR